MPEPSQKRITISTKGRVTATGATKDNAQLALSAKLVRAARATLNFKCDGNCEGGRYMAVIHYAKRIEGGDFTGVAIPAAAPNAGYVMGWMVGYEGKYEVVCECVKDNAEIEKSRR